MSSKTVLIATDSGGAFTYERPFFGLVKAALIDIGDLETPDIEVTDGVYGTSIIEVLGATSGPYQPSVFPAVVGTLKVDVTGAGSLKHGSIRFLLET